MDHMVGEAVVGAPVFAATRSIAAGYNFLFLFATVVSAWATYRLARLVGAPRLGAWLCGFLFAFSPYRAGNVDLLNQLQTQFLPLGIFFAFRYLQRWKVKDVVAVAGVFAVQVYFGWYYTFILATSLGLLVLWALVQKAWTPPREQIGALILLGAGVAFLALPVTLPYLLERMALPEFRRSLGEAALYSADLLDYVRVAPQSAAAQILHLPTGKQPYWPGTCAVALGIVGAWAMMSTGWKVACRNAVKGVSSGRPLAAVGGLLQWTRGLGVAGYFLVLAPVSLVLSLGPVLQCGGIRTWVPLPYSVLYFLLPGYSSMRAPARFAVLTTLAVVGLAAYGFRVLHERWKWQSPGRWWGLVTALFACSIVLAWSRPISTVTLPTPASMPPVYHWLTGRPAQEPVVEFPMPATDADENEEYALRQLCLLYTGKRRLDGISGFVSKRYRLFRDTAASFPSARALDAVRAMGGRVVIVHFADYPDPTRTRLRTAVSSESRLEPVAQFSEDHVFLLRP